MLQLRFICGLKRILLTLVCLIMPSLKLGLFARNQVVNIPEEGTVIQPVL